MSAPRLDWANGSVLALTDCAPSAAPFGYSFPDADPVARPDLMQRWFSDGRFHTRFGAFLLRTGPRTILVDCGMGPGPVAYFPGLSGKLLAGLAACGTDPDAVDLVVFTHLHLDHVGWAPSLRNARFVVSDAEWAHWSGDDRAGLPHHVEAVRRCVRPLADAGRLECVHGDAILAPGVRFVTAPGHTPGHRAVLAEAGARTVLIAGDLWHNPAQVAEPSWCHRADADKALATTTRQRIAQLAADGGWWVGAGHFPTDQAFGQIRADKTGLRFCPMPGLAATTG